MCCRISCGLLYCVDVISVSVSLIDDAYIDVGVFFFFFQAEDGIRDLVRSRGLGDVYKRQEQR